jgi:hypothetical protein
MELVKILEKNQKLHIQIVEMKVTSCRTMSNKKKVKKKLKTKILWAKQTIF